MTLRGVCYGRPLLQAWLFPDLNTIPNNCVRVNSIWLSGYGIGFLSRRPWFKSCPDLLFLPCIYSFVCVFFFFFLLRTFFVRIFFPRIDDRFRSSVTGVQCFDDGYVGKQPVAWKEYCVEYWLTLS